MKQAKLKPKTIRLLRRIQKAILKEPKQFFMEWFYAREVYGIKKIPNCGTAACIAGWAVALSKGVNPKKADTLTSYAWRDGKRALGITGHQAAQLFNTGGWPFYFRVEFNTTPSTKRAKLARIAVNRIEHFIKTGGRE